jgi:outer membrane biosynthesis protein TonB
MKLSWAVKLAVCFWACTSAEALAQDRTTAKPKKAAQVADPKPEPPKSNKSNKKKRTQKREQKPPVSTGTQLAEKPKAATPSAAPAAAAIDDSDVRTEGDKSIKALEFTGLDIEGQLKTPQMLFFLNRLRAEFDRPRLPHRSFMPELARSREHKEL